jgi:hypothetical protein
MNKEREYRAYAAACVDLANKAANDGFQDFIRAECVLSRHTKRTVFGEPIQARLRRAMLRH